MSRPLVPIIGGGPAGMSCALWLANYGLSPLIIEREQALGGIARRSLYPNEGLLGRPDESGQMTAEAFARHIARVGIETRLAAHPQQLQRERDGTFTIVVASRSARPAERLSSAAIVIATGTRFAGEEWLDLCANAREMAAAGRLHMGAPWALDPGPEQGSHVAVIGGGDNALDVARMLAEKNVRVSIVMRSHSPRAMPVMVRRLEKLKRAGAVRVLAGREVRALDHHARAGEKGLSAHVRLRLDDGSVLDADHVLLLFGYRPNSDEAFLEGLALARDARGYLVVSSDAETSCPDAFAVGDVCNPAHPSIASALASGTVAAREIAKRVQTA